MRRRRAADACTRFATASKWCAGPVAVAVGEWSHQTTQSLVAEKMAASSDRGSACTRRAAFATPARKASDACVSLSGSNEQAAIAGLPINGSLEEVIGLVGRDLVCRKQFREPASAGRHIENQLM